MSAAIDLIKMAVQIAGAKAPSVLAQYAALTYLNRTSRARAIRTVPQRHAPNVVASEATNPDRWDADIVVPVYNDFEGVRRLLQALSDEASCFANIIIVHDCSPDERVQPLIQEFGQRVPNAHVLQNDRNLGFLQTCNRGLQLSVRDAVILNTDIEIPRGALGRLLAVLQAGDDIASVTPFSSNAYGAGFPDLNYENRRPFGATTAEIDAAFQTIGALDPIEIPRGVGFCMAMSRLAIDAVGLFDTDFGAGYGEEADFCLKARAAGFRNVLAPNVYVYHQAGQSFGTSSTTKARGGLVRLLARHPEYPRLVRSYLSQNAARVVNFAALAALAEQLSSELPRAIATPQRGAPQHPGSRPYIEVYASEAHLVFEGERYDFSFAHGEVLRDAMRLARLCK